MASVASATVDARASAELSVSAPYVLRWDAPEECPTPAELRGKLDALSVRDGRDSPLQIDAEVRPSGNKFHLRLRLSGEPARHFEADNCRLLAETLVVLSAVALGSSPVPAATTAEDSRRSSHDERNRNQSTTLNEPTNLARASTLNDPKNLAKSTTLNEPTRLADAPRFSTDQPLTRYDLPAVASSLQLDASFGTSSTLGSGQILGSPMLALGLSYQFKFLLTALRASVASARIAKSELAGAESSTIHPTVRLGRWTLHTEICGGGSLGRALSAWDAWVCAEFGPSIWSAAADGLTNSTPRRSVLWLVGAAVRGRWHFAERWMLVGGGQFERPFHRLDWAVRLPTTDRVLILHKTPAFGASWTVGIAYSF